MLLKQMKYFITVVDCHSFTKSLSPLSQEDCLNIYKMCL